MSDNGTMLQKFREHYMQCGQTVQCILDFIEAQDAMLIEKKVDPMDPPAEIRKEIGEFYDYFAANFGDSDEVMGAIQQKWGPQPPAVLIIGFQGMFEKGEKAIAEKYDRIREGSREEWNISKLAAFIVKQSCHVSIIGPEDYSYELDWPIEVSSKEVNAVQILKGMLTDFLLHGEGMIVRRLCEPKDEVYGFLPDDGGVEAMEVDRLTFALSVHADDTMKDYLNHVVIKKAEIDFH